MVIILANAVFSAGYGGMRLWYYSPAFVLALMILVVYLGTLYHGLPLSVSKWLLRATFVVVLFTCMTYLGLVTFRGNNEAYFRLEFYRRIANSTPEDAVLYCINWSGGASFFTQRRMINGDGFVNSFDYIKRAKSGSLDSYFQEVKPNFFIEAGYGAKFSGNAMEVDLYGVNHFRFKADDLILRDDRYSGGRVFALYRFDPQLNYTSNR